MKKKNVACVCSKCNKPFTAFTKEDLCRECEQKRDAEKNKKIATLTCKDCGDTFYITAGEKEFYDSLEFALPTRCFGCRRKRKMSKAREEKNE